MEVIIVTIEMYWIFFAIIILIWSIFFHMKWKAERCKNLVDPFTVFSVGFFVYTAIGLYVQVGIAKYPAHVLLLFCISVIVGYIAFSLGYILNTKPIDIGYRHYKIKFTLNSNIIKNWRISILDTAMLLTLLLFIAIYHEVVFNMVFNFGSGLSYLEYAQRSERDALTGPIALLGRYFTLFLIAYPSYRMYKTHTVDLVSIILILTVTMYNIASGQRSILIYIMVAFLAFYNYRYKLMSIRQLLLIGGCGFLLLISLGHLRAESSLIVMLSMFWESGLKYIELTSSGEFINTVQTTLDYIGAISDGSMDFNYGYTWLVDLLIFIPTFLLPDRPLPWNEQYMLTFYPFAPSGIGHAGFILNEGYMSIGMVGIILELFAMGFIFAKVSSYFMNRKEDPIFLFMYAILIAHAFFIVRGSFLLGIKNYILEVLPFALMLILFRNRKKDR